MLADNGDGATSNGESMTITLATTPSPQLLEAVNSLIPQLSTSTPPLSLEQLSSLLAQDGVYVFLFHPQEDTEEVLGMLTLATFQIPTGRRGWIEDVVVDQGARGMGAGRSLVEAALGKAAEIGLATVDLTSRPSREAANRLYVRCGFEARETNVYRYKV